VITSERPAGFSRAFAFKKVAEPVAAARTACKNVDARKTNFAAAVWFDADQLAMIEEVHTPSGRHEVNVTTFPEWVPEEVAKAAAKLTDEEATSLLPVALTRTRGRKRSDRRRPRNFPGQ
jgi:hypothetical protein